MIDIKLFRKDNELSQVALAKILGCTQGFISSLERGVRPVPDNIITKLISLREYNTKHLVNDVLGPADKNMAVEQNNEITMNREVFDVLKNLSETVLSQQKTIEQIFLMNKKGDVHLEKNAVCAAATGSDK